MAEKAYDFTEATPFLIKKGAEESGGEFVRFESTMYPNTTQDKTALPHTRWGLDNDFEHIHPEQKERWEVLSGELRVAYEGIEQTLTEGDETTLPANVPHRHWNPTAEPIRVIWERRPAFQDAAWAETLYALAQAGKTDEDGFPGWLQAAVIADKYPNATAYPAGIPVAVQRLLFSLLAPIGRLAGYEATHSREASDVR